MSLKMRWFSTIFATYFAILPLFSVAQANSKASRISRIMEPQGQSIKFSKLQRLKSLRAQTTVSPEDRRDLKKTVEVDAQEQVRKNEARGHGGAMGTIQTLVFVSAISLYAIFNDERKKALAREGEIDQEAWLKNSKQALSYILGGGGIYMAILGDRVAKLVAGPAIEAFSPKEMAKTAGMAAQIRGFITQFFFSAVSTGIFFTSWELGSHLWEDSLLLIEDPADLEVAMTILLHLGQTLTYFFSGQLEKMNPQEFRVMGLMLANVFKILYVSELRDAWFYRTVSHGLLTGDFLAMVTAMAAAGMISKKLTQKLTWKRLKTLINIGTPVAAAVGTVHLPRSWLDSTTFFFKDLWYSINLLSESRHQNELAYQLKNSLRLEETSLTLVVSNTLLSLRTAREGNIRLLFEGLQVALNRHEYNLEFIREHLKSESTKTETIQSYLQDLHYYERQMRALSEHLFRFYDQRIMWTQNLLESLKQETTPLIGSSIAHIESELDLLREQKAVIAEFKQGFEKLIEKVNWSTAGLNDYQTFIGQWDRHAYEPTAAMSRKSKPKQAAPTKNHVEILKFIEFVDMVGFDETRNKRVSETGQN